jgi:hypothetical protein
MTHLARCIGIYRYNDSQIRNLTGHVRLISTLVRKIVGGICDIRILVYA